MTDHPPRPEGRSMPRSLVIIVFVALLILGLGWAALVPLRAQADESSHATYAAGVARGQVLLEGYPAIYEGTGTPIVKHDVVVPSSYQDVQAGAVCLFWNPGTPDSCTTDIPSTSSGDVGVWTYSANYPPAYYVLVGWVTRFLDGSHAWYAMRALTSLLCAALITTGVVGLWRVGGAALSVGAIGVITPTAMSYFGAINPAGPEIMACFALAGVLAPVAVERRMSATRLSGAGVVTAILVNTRPPALLWAFVIVLMAVCAMPLSAWRGLLRRRAMWWCLAIAGLGSAASLVWIEVAKPNESLLGFADPTMTMDQMLDNMWDSHDSYLESAVGNFAWADNPVPGWLQVVMYTALVLVLLSALVVGTWGERLAVVGGFLSLPTSAIAIQYSSLDTVGMMWQGRYNIPLLMGLMVTCFVILRRRTGLGRWIGTVLLAVFVFMETAMLLRVAYRYSVGLGNPFTVEALTKHHVVGVGLGLAGLVLLVVAFLRYRGADDDAPVLEAATVPAAAATAQ